MRAESHKPASFELLEAVKERKRFRRIRVAIAVSGVAVFAQLYMFQPLLPDLCEAFSISPAYSSFSVSSGTVGMACGLFVFAFAADALNRKRLMVGSILLSSLLTIASALSPNFVTLLVLNGLKGALLAGVSAVALAYLSEEMPRSVLGFTISLYLSGNTFGGMAGRVAAGLLSGWTSWPVIAAAVGSACLVLGLVFQAVLPASAHFVPGPVRVKKKLRLMGRFLKAPALLVLFCIATLIMGAFVSVYNYLAFRLEAPPFSLPHYVAASIFLMYLAGIAGSLLAGRWSDACSPAFILKVLLAVFAAGLAAMLSRSLWLTVAGLGVLTFGFFGAHTMASRLVSAYAPTGKSTAVSLYWLFYYVGSSVIGSATGLFLAQWRWGGFVLVLLLMVATALGLALVGARKGAA